MFVYMYCKAFLEWPHQLLLDDIEINFIIIISSSIVSVRILASIVNDHKMMCTLLVYCNDFSAKLLITRSLYNHQLFSTSLVN